MSSGESDGRGSDPRSLIKALVLSPFVSQKMANVTMKQNKEDLTVSEGSRRSRQITPVIDRTYPLSETPRPSGISKKDTPGGKSSSPSDRGA